MAQCNLDTHTYVYTNIHRHQAPLGKHHHTSSQTSQLRKQQSLISVALLFNFLFVPNWKSEGSVFLSLLVRHKFFDIKHGLAVSKLSLTRHEWEKRGLELLSLLVEAIDFQATYALFVCTDTLECKPVKCEVLHLSPVSSSLGFSAHKLAHVCTKYNLATLQIRFRYRMGRGLILSPYRLLYQDVMSYWVTWSRLNRVIIHLVFLFRASVNIAVALF